MFIDYDHGIQIRRHVQVEAQDVQRIEVRRNRDSTLAERAPVFNTLAKECGPVMQMEEGFEMVREFTGALRI